MTELRRVPRAEPLAGEQRRPATIHPERPASADHPAVSHDRAQTAEPRATSSREIRGSQPGDQTPRRDTLSRFEPARSGLPDVSHQDAARYIEANRGDRPWLNSARNVPADVQRVFAALDQGGGHAQIRHEGCSAQKRASSGCSTCKIPPSSTR